MMSFDWGEKFLGDWQINRHSGDLSRSINEMGALSWASLILIDEGFAFSYSTSDFCPLTFGNHSYTKKRCK